MELLNAIVITVNGVIWGWPMIILLLGTHIYMTAKTGFIQRFTITKGIRLSVEKDTKKYIHNLDAKDDTLVPVVK
ncbi:hypothetical protein DORLON_02832 [Dorea longicatena DSM 13814]|uniref:Uncharacterized protein n=1 Tax=Dorea longicatena DSM 13814 TaxID=411462 RepID=A6BKI0_9FIRM|nr:sodium:alanine symporter family protein [Dorea longicatena]EDM61797.1 hypothetical protein DORLON_02832 [Dorea longicatena DSM 13814]UWP21746.1 sodium:alanine symporter family protein [Dorea longicatena]